MSESGPVVRRSIGIVFSDGGLLALTSTLPGGAEAHGEEEVAAVLCDPDGAPLQFEESLLSTEYGEDGVQRRATLELWPDAEEMRPLRGAGTLINSVCVRAPGPRLARSPSSAGRSRAARGSAPTRSPARADG